jgi:hypothetical protein
MSNIDELLAGQPVFCFTSDIDWASEPVIEHTQGIFSRNGIIPTYFTTHSSLYLDSLVKKKEAMGGIHPNFLEASSHGNSFDEVCGYFDCFLPEYRRCFRSHRFFDVTDTNMILRDKGYLYDSNVFTFMEKIRPYRHFSGFVRFPSCWEDGTHLRNTASLELGRLLPFLDEPGLTIMSVHPLHMAINSPDFQYSRSLKDRLTREEMVAFAKESIAKVRHEGPGIATFFEEILQYVKRKGYPIYTLEELYQMITGDA